jgi:ABC-2 type transport system ATP-binding protein
MSDSPVVICENLTKKYGDFVALDNLSIQLQRGQILGFIGPNGAGKTTTIKILVGLSRPTSGSAKIAGADCEKDARKIKKLVGFMPDVFGAYDNMRVHEYLDFFGAAFKIPREERRKRIEACMEITGSTYMKDRHVDALSHGMKQRVAIARTMLHDPEVLILDEPANGLDPNARIEMRQILLRLAEMGKTLIVTSHILPELSRICDTVAIITQGKLRAFGPLTTIMRDISQRRMIELVLLKHDQADSVAKALTKQLGEEAQVTASAAEGEVRFSTTMDDAGLANLQKKLVAAGVGLVQFREVPLDLEDAFLEVTRQTDKGGGSGARPKVEAVAT